MSSQLSSQLSAAQSQMSKSAERLSSGLKLNGSGGDPVSQAMGSRLPRLPEQTTGGLLNRTDQYLPPPVAAAGLAASATGGATGASAAAAGAGASGVDANAGMAGGPTTSQGGGPDQAAQIPDVQSSFKMPTAEELTKQTSQYMNMGAQAATSILGSANQSATDLMKLVQEGLR
jgi:flagellin-like hook-associated protein FlgL